MTNLESKRLELLKILPELQCHECKDVPGPNGYDKNRYSCMKGSHVLCEKHRVKKCPCGSKIAKKPSSIIAKLLQDLPWMCQNYKNGCREFKMEVEGLDNHHRKCIFRYYLCNLIAWLYTYWFISLPGSDTDSRYRYCCSGGLSHLKINLFKLYQTSPRIMLQDWK